MGNSIWQATSGIMRPVLVLNVGLFVSPATIFSSKGLTTQVAVGKLNTRNALDAAVPPQVVFFAINHQGFHIGKDRGMCQNPFMSRKNRSTLPIILTNVNCQQYWPFDNLCVSSLTSECSQFVNGQQY